ncbi:DUF3726 domain-containing protein [Roseovarius sp. D22-M7]|uniref:DUF3726 domain-containing protein n=1 Tax=Roseovarius sp. D22-M7 TaxID=3127116 RepID=UPI0030104F52
MVSPGDPPPPGAAPTSDRPVRLSLSEINALCFKAARGAGLDWGEAEEAGWAAAWLSRAGLPGPSITLALLTEAPDLARPRPAPQHWKATPGAQCPLRCGIALADFAGLPEGPGAGTLHIGRVATPLMLLPFAARAAGRLGTGLHVTWDQHGALVHAANVAPQLDPVRQEGAQPADVAITAVQATTPGGTVQGAPPPIPAISLDDWRALDALALHITVPASVQSRAGAGAAGTDND